MSRVYLDVPIPRRKVVLSIRIAPVAICGLQTMSIKYVIQKSSNLIKAMKLLQLSSGITTNVALTMNVICTILLKTGLRYWRLNKLGQLT